MKTPFALLVGLSLGAVLSFTQCSPVSMCSPANCLGCCDGNGRCAAGTTNTGCGKDGVVCVACAAGQTCMSQVCSVVINNTGGGASGGTSGTGGGASGGTSGTGGGASGGTSGTGGGASGGTSGTGGGASGGSTSGCTVIQLVEGSSAAGTYRPTSTGTQMVWGVGDVLGPQGGMGNVFTRMRVQLYHPPGQPPTFPFTGPVPAAPYKTCDQCFQLAIACDRMGENCSGDFIARSGQYNFQSGSTNQAAGSFVGEATNLRFQAWDLVNDVPVSGQRCIDVGRMTWNATWP
ncbi:MAG: hypothetical protein IAE78_08425 [Myxococcus sp.]|nr:hypothetical protein [Myxococcus sp.]